MTQENTMQPSAGPEQNTAQQPIAAPLDAADVELAQAAAALERAKARKIEAEKQAEQIAAIRLAEHRAAAEKKLHDEREKSRLIQEQWAQKRQKEQEEREAKAREEQEKQRLLEDEVAREEKKRAEREKKLAEARRLQEQAFLEESAARTRLEEAARAIPVQELDPTGGRDLLLGLLAGKPESAVTPEPARVPQEVPDAVPDIFKPVNGRLDPAVFKARFEFAIFPFRGGTEFVAQGYRLKIEDASNLGREWYTAVPVQAVDDGEFFYRLQIADKPSVYCRVQIAGVDELAQFSLDELREGGSNETQD